MTSSNESNEEAISSENQSSHNPHLWVGRIMYSAGIIGIVVVILVMIAVPFVANQAGATLETNLLVLADGLDDLSTTIVIANDSMDKATLGRKMKNGECRTTKNGRKYCMRSGKVRFVKR